MYPPYCSMYVDCDVIELKLNIMTLSDTYETLSFIWKPIKCSSFYDRYQYEGIIYINNTQYL